MRVCEDPVVSWILWLIRGWKQHWQRADKTPALASEKHILAGRGSVTTRHTKIAETWVHTRCPAYTWMHFLNKGRETGKGGHSFCTAQKAPLCQRNFIYILETRNPIGLSELDSCNCEQDNITYHSFPLAFPTHTKASKGQSIRSYTVFLHGPFFPHDRFFSFIPHSLALFLRIFITFLFCFVFLVI